MSDQIVWGEILPEPIDFRTIRRKDTRRVYLLHDDQNEVATGMAKELKSTMRTIWKRCEFVTKIEDAERATILLTECRSRTFKRSQEEYRGFEEIEKENFLKKGKIVPKKKLKIVLKKRPRTNAVTKMKRRTFLSARVAPE